MIKKILVIGAGTLARCFLKHLTELGCDNSVQIIVVDQNAERIMNIASLSSHYSVSQHDIFQTRKFLEQENILYTFDDQTLIVCATGNWMVDLLSAETILRLYPQVYVYLFSHRFPPFIRNNLYELEQRVGTHFQYSDLKRLLLEKILTRMYFSSIRTHEIFSNKTQMVDLILTKLPSSSVFEALEEKPHTQMLINNRQLYKNYEACKELFEKKERLRLTLVGSSDDSMITLPRGLDQIIISKTDKLMIVDDLASEYPFELLLFLIEKNLTKNIWYLGPSSKVHQIVDRYPYLENQVMILDEEDFKLFLLNHEILMRECSAFMLLFDRTIKNITYLDIIDEVREEMGLDRGRVLLLDGDLLNSLAIRSFNRILLAKALSEKEKDDRTLQQIIDEFESSRIFVQRREVYNEILSKVLVRFFPEQDHRFRSTQNSHIRLFQVTVDNLLEIKRLFERRESSIIGVERDRIGFLKRGEYQLEELQVGDQLFYLD